MYIPLKPLFSRHKGIGVQFTDEPTGNLDRENTKQVMNLLKECQAMYSQTIIMVTHDIDLAKRADALIYMEDGQVKRYETS